MPHPTSSTSHRPAAFAPCPASGVTSGSGFNTASEVFYEEEFRALGCEVAVSTVDGSRGVGGFVTTAIAERGLDFDYFYACGPLPMLHALYNAVEPNM